MRGKLLPQRTPNHIQHRIRPEQHIVIPEPQYTISRLFQLIGATLVVFDLLQVLTTIQLDNQPTLKATEVDNKTFNPMLPTKPATKLTTPKAIPKFVLCIGCMLAK